MARTLMFTPARSKDDRTTEDRSAIQSFRSGAARSLLARSADGPSFAQHQGGSVMIAIVDYGAGNLTSVKKALDWLGHTSVITSDPAQVSMPPE